MESNFLDAQAYSKELPRIKENNPYAVITHDLYPSTTVSGSAGL
jgi:hypothetical protein